MLLAQCNQFFIIMKYGILVGSLCFCIDLCVIWIYSNPRSCSSKSCVFEVSHCIGVRALSRLLKVRQGQKVSWDKCPLLHHSLYALKLSISLNSSMFGWIVGHAKLLSLIDVWSALHHVQAGSEHFGRSFTVLRAVIAKA